MTGLSRRGLILAAAAAAVAGPALAEEKVVSLAGRFPFLDTYLKIPAGQRTRFTLGYYFTSEGKPVTGVKVWIIENGARTLLPIGPDGRVLRLPTLAQLKSKAQLAIEGPSDRKYGITLNVEPIARPAVELDAQDLALAVSQAAFGAKSAAGLLGFVVPKMERVYFNKAKGATVIYADGRRAPLPLFQKKVPVFDPADHKGAKTIVFTQAPVQMSIGPAKKG
jgi:hypothetical protein